MWRDIVTSLYPDALHRTYRVPPEYFSRVPHGSDTASGKCVGRLALNRPVRPAARVPTVPPSSQPSVSANIPPASQRSNPPTPISTTVCVQGNDYRDYAPQCQVLAKLQELGNVLREPMFILSQLNFGDYINEPSYAAAVKASQLPKSLQPSDLGTKYKAGDFDILLIHRRHGVLVGELKSVGKDPPGEDQPGVDQPGVDRTPAQADDDVAKRVGEAVKQLDKSKTVVSHLVSDIAPGLTVRKTLFLPYVSSSQLQRVLSADRQLEQEVCRCLGVANAADAVQMCCCSDQLSDPATYGDVTPAILSQLTTWWHRRLTCTMDSILTDNIYLDIMARFVGPATSVNVCCSVPPRVKVRRVGEAEACLVLTRQQLDLMHRSPPRVFITGPPGTGKTTMLVLQGLRWLRDGHDVYVISTHPDSFAANMMILHQMHKMLPADPAASPAAGKAHLISYHFSRGSSDQDREAVKDLLQFVRGGTLCVLVDETIDFSFFPVSARQGLQRLVSSLARRVPNFNVWMAGTCYINIPPGLQTEVLTTPLRSSPAVVEEVRKVLEQFSDSVNGYSDSGLSVLGDGPSVVRLSHHGNAHTGQRPTNCVQCGREVAAELRRLGVGSGGRYATNSSESLAYRDVFVLTICNVQDDVRDDAGNVTSPATGFVRGLRDEQIPVCVLDRGRELRDVVGWEKRVSDVAVAKADQVTVAHKDSVHGLERRVVVWLTASGGWYYLNDPFRLLGFSRCITQLVMVAPPDDRRTKASDSSHRSHTPSEDNTGGENKTTEETHL